MKSAKEKAISRIKRRWDEANKDKFEKEQEYQRDKIFIAETINTKGWSILVKSLHVTVDRLTKELYEISSFRVLKGIELRSEIRSLKNLLLSMQKNEKIHLSEKLKE